MKRKRIVTFKVKETPSDRYTRIGFKIGDTFTVDFDKEMENLREYGTIMTLVGQNDWCTFKPNEIHIIRAKYIDTYDADVSDMINEMNDIAKNKS